MGTQPMVPKIAEAVGELVAETVTKGAVVAAKWAAGAEDASLVPQSAVQTTSWVLSTLKI
jgi:hypothetical protein